LCAGASVVGPRLTPQLNCLQWYVSHDSGTLSPQDSPESLSQALLEEIRAWDSGKRNPEEISRYWGSLLHAENSCKRIIAACEAAQSGKAAL
jgi:glycosyltransferase-like protein